MKNKKVLYIITMMVFGSIGLFVRNIPLPSGQIALVRGVIGCIFLLAVCPITKQKISMRAIRSNLLLLILSGTAIGFNWILLFEAYKYTSIANATLSYYFAPVFIILLSPFYLKERLTITKVISIVGAIIGMFLIAGSKGESGSNDILGIGYGLIAAVLYAGVVIMNKFLKNLSGIETTVIQLGAASIVLMPYILLTQGLQVFSLERKALLLLLIVGIIHTGLAYLMYFTAIKNLNGHTIAVFSYMDPISAILLSVLLLNERMGILQVAGACLILGASFANEWFDRRILKREKEMGVCKEEL